jgi:CRP/FNR family transcriptional regulator, cyclic AMP receptor protein
METIRLLQENRLFAGIEKRVVAACAPYFRAVPTNRGRIFEQGDAAAVVYLIEDGTVYISGANSDSEVRITDILKAGDFFGEEALLEHPFRTTAAASLADVRLWSVNAQALTWMVKRYPTIALNIVRRLSERHRNAISIVEETRYQRVAERLLALFRHLGRVELTHAEIASLVGSTRETVSLEIGRLLRAGSIRREGRAIVLPSA